MANPGAVLIIGPSWVGDMVMAQSLFMALKKQDPAIAIDVLAPEWTKPLLERMSEVRRAISMPVTHGVFGWRQRQKIGHSLRGRYQQAIVLPNSWKSALIPWFAKIPLRTGWRGEMRYGLLNDIRKLDKPALPLMVERFVALAQPAEQAHQTPVYNAPAMQAGSAAEAINPSRTANQKRLILCPGAEFGPAKQWPAQHYADVARHFIGQGWQVLILGSKADATVAETIRQAAAQKADDTAVINLAGETQLAEAIDLLATADQVISNDSGLMHIAAALDKPLVAVYGPTSPAFTPPLSEKALVRQIAVDCGPCFQRHCPEGHHKCMLELSPASVIAEINLLQAC